MARTLPTPAQMEALDEIFEFCEQVEYRNGHTLRQAKAALRRLKALLPKGRRARS